MLQWHQRQLVCSWFDTASWVTLLMMIICYSAGNRVTGILKSLPSFYHLLWLLSSQDPWIPGGSLMEQTPHISSDKPKEKVIRGLFFSPPKWFISPGLVWMSPKQEGHLLEEAFPKHSDTLLIHWFVCSFTFYPSNLDEFGYRMKYWDSKTDEWWCCILWGELCHSKRYDQDFSGGTVVKNPPANAGDTGSSPGLGRSHMPRSN